MDGETAPSKPKAQAPSDRARVRRLPERGSYERELIESILDAAVVAHVGFADADQPYVIPVTFVRIDEHVYFHGSSASRLLRHASRQFPVCFTVTLLDGIVFARSAFHHSLNYRSVVVLGNGRLVEDEQRKLLVLERLVERFAAGRSQQVRAPSPLELRATALVELSLAEASAKTRTGGPKDDAEDMDIPCWAGELPVRLLAGAPLAAEGVATQAQAPEPGAALRLADS